MCGRFAQYQASQTIWPSAEQDVISEYDSVPIACYNVAPSTMVHMLHDETRGIHAQPGGAGRCTGAVPVDDVEEREGDGLVIITQPSDGDMLTIHDRQPVVLPPAAG